jgi:hypothetical protein
MSTSANELYLNVTTTEIDIGILLSALAGPISPIERKSSAIPIELSCKMENTFALIYF